MTSNVVPFPNRNTRLAMLREALDEACVGLAGHALDKLPEDAIEKVDAALAKYMTWFMRP